ncbi:MAG: histidinol-phosphate transaminase, partial [Acutalibacteraceae bacterium]
MSKFLRDFYAPLEPYTPGEQLNDKKYIKLNTNESPFPPSPEVSRVISKSAVDSLNLYSDPELKALKDTVAEHFSLVRDNVFCA